MPATADRCQGPCLPHCRVPHPGGGGGWRAAAVLFGVLLALSLGGCHAVTLHRRRRRTTPVERIDAVPAPCCRRHYGEVFLLGLFLVLTGVILGLFYRMKRTNE